MRDRTVLDTVTGMFVRTGQSWFIKPRSAA